MIFDAIKLVTTGFREILFFKKPKPIITKIEQTRRSRVVQPEAEAETRPVGFLSREDFEKQKIDKHVEIILSKYEKLRDKVPSSPDFLGGDIVYPKRKKRIFQISRPLPDFSELRDEMEASAKGEGVGKSRGKLRKNLKYHPYNPELRALNGIQIFNDTAQSGLDEKRLDIMQSALIELAQAMHNGALSIYYVNWWVKIYIKYLEFLQRRILAEYNQISNNYHWQIQRIAEEMHHLALQVTSMLTIKSQLAGISMLKAKMKGSPYIFDPLTQREIRGACLALEGDESKNVSVGKSPKHILWEVITIATLFARAPMFTNLVHELMSVIPDSSRVLILQKNLVATVMAVSEYQRSLSMGDLGKKIEAAHRIYNRCVEVIAHHLGHVSPKRLYEVDPFLKAAWITKESNGLFEREEYKKMCEQSMQYLTAVLENPDAVRGSFEIARQLQENLHNIMMEYGWTMF